MPQRVWSSTTDVSVADNLFGLSESDFFYCLVEIVANLLFVQALVLISDQEIRILINPSQCAKWPRNGAAIK